MNKDSLPRITYRFRLKLREYVRTKNKNVNQLYKRSQATTSREADAHWEAAIVREQDGGAVLLSSTSRDDRIGVAGLAG